MSVNDKDLAAYNYIGAADLYIVIEGIFIDEFESLIIMPDEEKDVFSQDGWETINDKVYPYTYVNKKEKQLLEKFKLESGVIVTTLFRAK